MKTLHIVGFKNSGKTTLITKWVSFLKAKGYTVAVLKHHGHGGLPQMPDETTDTMCFFENGADVSVVAGGGAVQLLMNGQPNFADMKAIATIGHPDILLIEGYKEEVGDKVILVRDREDWTTLQKLQGAKLIVGCSQLSTDIPHIASRSDDDLLYRWLLHWIGKEE